MRNFLYFSSAFSALILSLIFAEADHSAARGEELTWHKNVQQAWRQAQAENRPMLLYAHMHNCHYCRKLEQTTLRNASVQAEIQRRFVAASFDSAHQRDLVRRLRLRSYPSLIIVAPDGKVLDVMTGYLTAGQLQNRIRTATVALK